MLEYNFIKAYARITVSIVIHFLVKFLSVLRKRPLKNSAIKPYCIRE